MATERKPPRLPAVELAPAAERGEHWWPAALAIVAVVVLHVVLPARYRVQPAWVLPVVLLTLLAVMIVGDPGRIDRQKTWLRFLMGITIALLTLANLLAAVRLVVDILTNNKLYANNPGGELAAGGVIWATNVIAFGLWYWDLDRGGAAARAHHPDRNPAFVFPEMQLTDYVPIGWVPQFLDYLFLSFWTSTAFSPSDTVAIRPWAKALMLFEAGASLILGAHRHFSRDQHPLASGLPHRPGPGVICRRTRYRGPRMRRVRWPSAISGSRLARSSAARPAKRRRRCRAARRCPSRAAQMAICLSAVTRGHRLKNKPGAPEHRPLQAADAGSPTQGDPGCARGRASCWSCRGTSRRLRCRLGCLPEVRPASRRSAGDGD